jgi:hypothetical protein
MTSKKDEEIKVEWDASPECIDGMLNLVGEPDWTITRVRLMGLGPTGFELAWETKSAGFGVVTILVKSDKLYCGNEGMGKKFIKSVFDRFVEDLTLLE